VAYQRPDVTVVDLAVDAALGAWLGSVVFFSFVAAPALFDELGKDRAGDAVNVVFPRYYAFGLGAGLAALASWLVGVLALDAPEPSLVAVGAVVAAIAANAYARFVLIPKMEAAGSDAFAQYHKQSVVLNLVALVGIAVALAAANL